MSGIRVGLDYAGVAVVARAHGIEFDAALLDQLQAMEVEAMKAWAEQRDD